MSRADLWRSRALLVGVFLVGPFVAGPFSEGLLTPQAAFAQTPSSSLPQTNRQPQTNPQPQTTGPKTAPASPIDDPYRAYQAGQYEQALAGLIDEQVARPEDPDLLLNVGSAQYQLGDYQAAERSYSGAARAIDPVRRAEALYNLGNTAYRQGKLLEAIERYTAALDFNPDDEDAKFNLEFVREEMRRRQEEAQKQQQEQQQNQNGQDNQDQQQPQDSGQNDQNQSGNQQQQEQQGEGDGAESDRDGDGLPDEVERQGRNPTDPSNPDTDGDGRLDGEEDSNHNGNVDPGETDPNVADGEGGQESQSETDPQSQQESAGEAGQQPAGAREMTEAEAERYLQALDESRPVDPKSRKPARRVRVEKDW